MRKRRRELERSQAGQLNLEGATLAFDSHGLGWAQLKSPLTLSKAYLPRLPDTLWGDG